MKDIIKAYIEEHKQEFLDELFEFLRIPSISADSRHIPDMLRAANFLKDKLEVLGIENLELLETGGFPVVYGEKIIDPSFPTIMVYGHYDVQPPDPLDLWESPPFEPIIKDEKIYARGACDDKGQVYMHVKAYQVLKELGMMNCNVKFFIEGEEEIGSSNLEGALRKYAHKIKCDLILISDTSIISNDVPSVCIGLRGLSYLEVEVTGPNRDLHSGVYGGAVDNPINVLCEMIASLKDENRKITIPGFYDDVVVLTAEERAEMGKMPFDQSDYNSLLNIDATRGENGYSTIEQTTIRPTLDVNGIWGGYTGEGSKTVLPSKAYAKISMRLVANQNYENITELFQKHFESIAPKTVKVKVKPFHGGNPYLTDTNTTAYKAAVTSIKETFGIKPIPAYEGGSIPILALFKEILNAPILLMGFGLDTDAIHSPNEHFGVFNFFKGIETISHFYPNFVKIEEAERVTV